MYQIIIIYYSHIMWLIHFKYDYFFTHDNLMVTYQNLVFSLHFSTLFNYNQLLFVMCFFDTLRICWYIIKKFNWKLLCMFKHNTCKKSFQNTWTKGCHIKGYCKIIVNVSKNNNAPITHLWTMHSICHHLFFIHNKWMLAC
jgi:hypothetical protein